MYGECDNEREVEIQVKIHLQYHPHCFEFPALFNTMLPWLIIKTFWNQFVFAFKIKAYLILFSWHGQNFWPKDLFCSEYVFTPLGDPQNISQKKTLKNDFENLSKLSPILAGSLLLLLIGFLLGSRLLSAPLGFSEPRTQALGGFSELLAIFRVSWIAESIENRGNHWWRRREVRWGTR